MSLVIRNFAQQIRLNRYVDLALDLTTKVISRTGINDAPGRDISILVDQQAIAQSVTNCLAAVAGEYVLRPDFGCNLRRFLFEPVTEFRAHAIGKHVQDTLSRFEPRIRVRNITVVADQRRQLYDLTITYSVPALDASNADTLLKMGGVLRDSDAISIAPRTN